MKILTWIVIGSVVALPELKAEPDAEPNHRGAARRIAEPPQFATDESVLKEAAGSPAAETCHPADDILSPPPRLQGTMSVNSWSRGRKRLLLLRTAFPDVPEEPISREAANELALATAEFLFRMSHGALSLETTVTEVLMLPRTTAQYASPTAILGLLPDARTAALQSNVDYRDYDLDAAYFRLNGVSSQAYVGRRGTWLNGSSVGQFCHEILHNLGLFHANAWITQDGSVTGEGANRECGDVFDTMGYGLANGCAVNAALQSQLNWLPPEAIRQVTGPGIYPLRPVDTAVLQPQAALALRIPGGSQPDYWFEVRTPVSDANVAPPGMLVHWDASGAGHGGTRLLDLRPGGSGGCYDAFLPWHRSWRIPGSDLKVTPRPNLDTSSSALLEVTLSHYACIDAPAPPDEYPSTPWLQTPVSSAAAHAGGSTWSGEADIPAAGAYFVWLRVDPPAPDDALWTVLMESGPSANGQVAGFRQSPSARWAPLAPADGGPSPSADNPRLRWNLAPGTHRFRLTCNHPQAVLKAVVLTDDPEPNTPPRAHRLPGQRLTVGGPPKTVPLPVDDLETPPMSLRLVVRGSDEGVLKVGKPIWQEADAQWTVTLEPSEYRVGQAEVTLVVTDTDANSSRTLFPVDVVSPLQELVDRAGPGTRVRLSPGFHSGPIRIEKDLHLTGLGTSLRPLGEATTLVVGADSRVVLSALTLEGGGSAVVNFGELTIEDVVIRGVRAEDGKVAIRNLGSLVLRRCTVTDNSANGPGGAIDNSPTGSLLIEDSTLFANATRNGNGGAIHNQGRLEIVNTTLSGNVAVRESEGPDGSKPTAFGGAIDNQGHLLLRNCTVCRNQSTTGGGGVANSTGFAALRNTIVAANRVQGRPASDVWGRWILEAANLVQDISDATLYGALGESLLSGDPRLTPLGNQGGPTFSHALGPESPALAKARPDNLATDQRGWSRDALNPDLGAVESRTHPPATTPCPAVRLSIHRGSNSPPVLIVEAPPGVGCALETGGPLTHWVPWMVVFPDSPTTEIPLSNDSPGLCLFRAHLFHW